MSQVSRGHSPIAAVLRPLALGVASLLVGGCISLNSVQSEKQLSTPPDLSRMCAYSWKKGEALFRAENILSYDWGPPSAFGYGAVLSGVEKLASGCPDTEPRPPAEVSVYYLEYASKLYGWAVVVPTALLSVFTIGITPVPVARNYVACVQATSSDGLDRVAIAEGSISSLENVWGGIDWRFAKGKTERTQRRVQLMQDLTSQAWHKLWREQDDNLGAQNCTHKLEAIAGA